MQTPQVLAYGLGPERAARIRTLCMVQRLRFVPVAPADCGETVGAAAGILPRTGAPAPETPLEEEMLVLCGFSEAALGGFLQGFRRAGIPPVALKAVLPPSNAVWPPQKLQQELQRERAAMEG